MQKVYPLPFEIRHSKMTLLKLTKQHDQKNKNIVQAFTDQRHHPILFLKKGSLRLHLDNTYFLFYFSFRGLTIFQVLKGKPLPTFLETFLK